MYDAVVGWWVSTVGVPGAKVPGAQQGKRGVSRTRDGALAKDRSLRRSGSASSFVRGAGLERGSSHPNSSLLVVAGRSHGRGRAWVTKGVLAGNLICLSWKDMRFARRPCTAPSYSMGLILDARGRSSPSGFGSMGPSGSWRSERDSERRRRWHSRGSDFKLSWTRDVRLDLSRFRPPPINLGGKM